MKPSPVHKNAAPRAHLIGIGGIGMSALAQYMASDGWSVTGSDLARSIITDDLARRRIRTHIGHARHMVRADTDLVIRSQAIPFDDPECRTARRLGIPILTYPEMVGRISKQYRTVAVAGSHGKSTTTALVALVLQVAKFDPTVMIGTRVPQLGGNFRKGKSEYLVLEADEYGKAFLNYAPGIAVITNIDKEHLDTYGTLRGVQKAFLSFVERIAPGGVLIANRDDANSFRMHTKIAAIARRNDLSVVWYSLGSREAKKVRKVMPIPGEHNISNALAAFMLARRLGISERTALRAIGSYRGSWRRMEYKGRLAIRDKRGAALADVFDDYAHHPTEIRATLRAVRDAYPARPIICVFQPHQAERLKRLFRDFETAFSDADITLMLPSYRVAGRDKEHAAFSAQKLVEAIRRRHAHQKVFYLENPKNVKSALATLLTTIGEDLCEPVEKIKNGTKRFAPPKTERPIVIMMGAGTIAEYTPLLVRR